VLLLANKLSQENEENKVMSKISDQLLQQQDMKLEYEMKYMDWMYDTFQPQHLSESDIDKMELDYSNSQKATSNILSVSVPKSTINTTETTTRRSA